ncbi:Hypp4226 [Branchiostoma lanceolatum]|uniref:Hypp4226 protein n=1 Tax=Branchiostoma lanceolatum TaxID=7740 RepID=A0A8K0A7T8_BRALA|nr:Hypp4226 [Branchiostoma lanceolatum]
MSVRFAVSSVKEDEDGITNEPASASSPSEASGPLSPVSPPPRIEIVEYGREPHTYQKDQQVYRRIHSSLRPTRFTQACPTC